MDRGTIKEVKMRYANKSTVIEAHIQRVVEALGAQYDGLSREDRGRITREICARTGLGEDVVFKIRQGRRTTFETAFLLAPVVGVEIVSG